MRIELEFQDRVGVALEKLLPPGDMMEEVLSIPDVMRFLSKHFERGEMSAVYHHAMILLERTLGPNFFNRLPMSGGE